MGASFNCHWEKYEEYASDDTNCPFVSITIRIFFPEIYKRGLKRAKHVIFCKHDTHYDHGFV
jgi:hypothetical protein